MSVLGVGGASAISYSTDTAMILHNVPPEDLLANTAASVTARSTS